MSNKEKLEVLKDILGRYNTTGGECLFFCPKCKHHKPKLSVNLDKNVFKCWICDYKSNSVFRLVRRYGSFLNKEKWRTLDDHVDIGEFDEIINSLFPEKQEDYDQVVDLPKEFVSLCNNNGDLISKKPRNYLSNRGVTKNDILFWKIGYCPSGEYSGRIIIPSFNDEGYCSFFIARAYDENWRKYMNPKAAKSKIIFNELYINWDEDIVLTEGIFDAIVAGKNSIPILGSSLKEASKLFKSIIINDTPVYVALDKDAERKASILIDSLVKYGIEVYKVDISPYNDVGEMDRKEFLTRKQNARQLSSEDAFYEKILNGFRI